MRPGLSAFVLVAALSGCLANTLPAPPDLPGLAIGEAVRVDAAQPAREPAILEAPDGTLFVAGFWGFGRHTEYPGSPANVLQAPLLWRSADAGATWERLDTGTPLDGAIGNSDNDLAVAGDGTLYFTTLSYYSPVTLPVDPPALPADPATTLTVVVGASRDNGDTWTWHTLDQGSGRSHPWVAVAPGGTAHVVWADGMGIRRATSEDRGATWAETEARVHGAGEAGGIVAWGEALAVRVAPIGSDADGVAISADNGDTWTFHAPPREAVSDPALTGFGSVAFDSRGALYIVRTEGTPMGDVVRASRSIDLGATWDTVTLAREAEGTVPYFPYARGGPEGDLAVTWFARTDDTVAAKVLRARWTPGERGESQVSVGTFAADTGGLNHADYYQVAVLRDGTLAAAVPVTTPDLGQWFDYRTAR